MATREEKQEELRRILRQFDKDVDLLNKKVLDIVDDLHTNKNISYDKAYEIALKELNYNYVVTNLVIDSSMKSMGVQATVSKPAVLREWMLDRIWPGDELTISETVSKNTRLVRKQIKKQLKTKSNWIKVARNIKKDANIEAELSNYLKRLMSAAKNAGLEGAENAQYKKAMKAALKNIENLSLNDAPTTALKKAYVKLFDKVNSFATDNLDKFVKNATAAKAEYFAQRIARTEMARANATAMQLKIDARPQIIGWKSNLNSRHVIVDICDFWAKADLYGLGVGIYPRTVDIQIPYHPHCFCFTSFVYEQDIQRPRFISANGAKFLKDNPKIASASTMMKKSDYQKFLESPAKWPLYLRGWKKLKRIPRPPKGTVKI